MATFNELVTTSRRSLVHLSRHPQAVAKAKHKYFSDFKILHPIATINCNYLKMDYLEMEDLRLVHSTLLLTMSL